jgi:hypothetical protein
MNDYMHVANSLWLWIGAGIPVALVLLQSWILCRRSIQDGQKMGITQDQIRRAIRSSAFASIGPSLAIFAGLITLMQALGSPVAWLRLSYIGSVAYELMAASFASDAMNVKLGSPEMTDMVFACALWVMTLGSIGWPLFAGLFAHKLETVRHKFSGGKSEMVPIVAAGGMIGAFTYLSLDRVIPFSLANKGALAAIAGFVCMAVFTLHAKKSGSRWADEWGVTISMFVGMAVAVIF